MSQVIHKTCASWGVTNCNKQLFAQRPPTTTLRWDQVTCPKCLAQCPKSRALKVLEKRYQFCIAQKNQWAARAEEAAKACTALKAT